MQFLKKLIVKLFLSQEVEALKLRLNEATRSLNQIEKEVVSIPKEASAEVHIVAKKVLNQVLQSADQVRTKCCGFTHDWEAQLYELYDTAKTDAHSAASYAEVLIDRTKLFF